MQTAAVHLVLIALSALALSRGPARAQLGPSAGVTFAEAAGPQALPGGCARLNNIWCVAQTFGDPWLGSTSSDGRYAVFGDARWSARAAALDLRSRYQGGQRSARALASQFIPPCVTPPSAAAGTAAPAGETAPPTEGPRPYFSGPEPHTPSAACPPLDPARLVVGLRVGFDDDLGLIDDQGQPTANLRAVLSNLARAMSGAEPPPSMLDLAMEAVAWTRINQNEAGFEAWRSASPVRIAGVARFETFLAQQGVADVLPTYQILRTGSDWRGCGAPFVVPPDATWRNVVGPLGLIRDRIKPQFPALEAMSGYRDPWQNVCMGGAESSAHRQFLALDLVPNSGIERFPLMKALCVTYNGEGAVRNMGLGFYKGVRFHVDTWKHRTWANVDGRPLNVCNEEAPVAGPSAPVPYNQLNAQPAPSASND